MSPGGEAEAMTSALASSSSFRGEDEQEEEDEFGYAFEGKKREGVTHKHEFRAKPMPVELVTNVKSMPMGALAEVVPAGCCSPRHRHAFGCSLVELNGILRSGEQYLPGPRRRTRKKRRRRRRREKKGTGRMRRRRRRRRRRWRRLK